MKHALHLLFFLSASCSAMSGCAKPAAAEGGEPSTETHDSVKLEPGSPRMKFVKVEVLEETDAAATVTLTGRVTFDEDRTQRVSTPLDGRATALLVKPGDKVKVGQSLIELSSPQVAQFQSDVQRAHQARTLSSCSSRIGRTVGPVAVFFMRSRSGTRAASIGTCRTPLTDLV